MIGRDQSMIGHDQSLIGHDQSLIGLDQSMLVVTNSKKYIKQWILCDKIFIYKADIKTNT